MTFGFRQQMAMSDGVVASMDISSLLLEKIPGAVCVRKASTDDDKQGTDYFVDHLRGVPVSVDIKARDVDPISTFKSDDLALETWSVMPGGGGPSKKGWTLDENKRTDYILWLFAPTKRYCLVPFHPLQVAFRLKAREWTRKYRTVRQRNYGYVSECVFVPRADIWRAIYSVSNGNLSDGGRPIAVQVVP